MIWQTSPKRRTGILTDIPASGLRREKGLFGAVCGGFPPGQDIGGSQWWITIPAPELKWITSLRFHFGSLKNFFNFSVLHKYESCGQNSFLPDGRIAPGWLMDNPSKSQRNS